LPTLVGLVVGAAVGAVIAAAAAWRTDWRVQASVAGVVAGAFFGAILGSALFDNPGAVAISIVVGLLTWIIGAVWLAARRGFDPESRYALLLPRESIAAFEKTREFVTRQWERQKGRMMGR
jgi:MFS family permease